MRLVRYGERGKERPGILDAQGLLRDLSGVVRDIVQGLGEQERRVQAHDAASLTCSP